MYNNNELEISQDNGKSITNGSRTCQELLNSCSVSQTVNNVLMLFKKSRGRGDNHDKQQDTVANQE